MAGSTITLLQDILKEDYQGAVRDQLHREMRLLQLFEKGKASWSGKDFVVGLRVGKNTGIGFRGESVAGSPATLPTAGNQRFLKILNRAKFLYGSFEVGGPDIAASSNGGSMALANSLHDEMKFLVEDVKDFADKMLFTGGKVKGLINEQKVLDPAAAGAGTTAATAAGAVSATFQYSGDHTPFASCLTGAANVATWVHVEAVGMDDYNVATSGGASTVNLDAGGELYVSASDEAAGTIELTVYGPAGTNFSTLGVADGSAIAIQLETAGTIGTYWVGNAAFPDNDPLLQYSGILDNLCNPAHHGIARDGASVTAAAAGSAAKAADELQSTILNMSDAAAVEAVTGVASSAVGGARVAIDSGRMQKALDVVRNESKRRPDIWLTNPLTRHKYIASATLTQNVNAGSAGGVDFGSVEQKLGFAGIPVEVDSNCPKSMLVGLNTGAWKLYELQPGDFDDTDGKILHKISGEDRYEGNWKWYCQLVCEYPNQNVVICGYDI